MLRRADVFIQIDSKSLTNKGENLFDAIGRPFDCKEFVKKLQALSKWLRLRGHYGVERCDDRPSLLQCAIARVDPNAVQEISPGRLVCFTSTARQLTAEQL
jgi:hypothetical protein